MDYVTIGNTKIEKNAVLAPMAGIADTAYRLMAKEYGAAMVYSEMVSSKGLVYTDRKSAELMTVTDAERPMGIQLFGCEPDFMGKAAVMAAEYKPDFIDINCGCPVPKIIKTGAGSALTRAPDRLFKVAEAVVKAAGGRPEAGGVPVTVKIRSGWESKQMTWRAAAEAALDAGVSAITIHPRTRAQGYEGHSDWGIMKELVELVNGRIPVFGSGDLFKPEDARAMLEQTGADAVMFARGAMGNPFIFRDAMSLFLRKNV